MYQGTEIELIIETGLPDTGRMADIELLKNQIIGNSESWWGLMSYLAGYYLYCYEEPLASSILPILPINLSCIL